MIKSVLVSPAGFRPDRAVLPSNLVRRARVSAHLARALQTPLTVVTAPAGSGKTTALRTWLDEEVLPHAWLSLDEDDEVEIFLRHLVATVQTVCPTFGSPILASLAGAAEPPLSVLAGTLIAELSEISSN